MKQQQEQPKEQQQELWLLLLRLLSFRDPKQNSPSAASGCTMGSAENPAGNNTRGFCDEHFEMHSAQPTALAASPAAAVSLGSSGQFVRCKKKTQNWQCKNMAGSNTRGFCNKHFKRYCRTAGAAASVPRAAPTVAPAAAAAAVAGPSGSTDQTRCKKKTHNWRCKNMAGRNTRGFCNKHFDMYCVQPTAASAASASASAAAAAAVSSGSAGHRRIRCKMETAVRQWGVWHCPNFAGHNTEGFCNEHFEMFCHVESLECAASPDDQLAGSIYSVPIKTEGGDDTDT